MFDPYGVLFIARTLSCYSLKSITATYLSRQIVLQKRNETKQNKIYAPSRNRRVTVVAIYFKFLSKDGITYQELFPHVSQQRPDLTFFVWSNKKGHRKGSGFS